MTTDTFTNSLPSVPASADSPRLAQSCMLVQLNLSCWQARKYDRKVSHEAEVSHNTAAGALRTTKRLMPAQAPAYEAMWSIAGEIRKVYYANTLPWCEGTGPRILAASNFMKFADEMRPLVAKFVAAQKVFEAEYPALKANAATELNGAYRESDYPLDAPKRFSVSTNMFPISVDTTDFRMSLSDEEVTLLESNMQAGISHAVKSAFESLHEALTRMHESLSQPEKIYRDTLFTNLKQLCEVLPALNITNNPELTAATERIKQNILSVSPNTARENKGTRANIAEEAKKISESMKGFFV